MNLGRNKRRTRERSSPLSPCSHTLVCHYQLFLPFLLSRQLSAEVKTCWCLQIPAEVLVQMLTALQHASWGGARLLAPHQPCVPFVLQISTPSLTWTTKARSVSNRSWLAECRQQLSPNHLGIVINTSSHCPAWVQTKHKRLTWRLCV